MCAKVAMGYREAHQTLNQIKSSKDRGRNSGRRKKIPKRVYYCENCQAWHLTSSAHEYMEGREWK